MVSLTNILVAVAAEIRELFPTEPCHIDFISSDIDRPAWGVRVAGLSMTPANHDTMSVGLEVEVLILTEKNDYYASSNEELLRKLCLLEGLFAGQCLVVEDRHLLISQAVGKVEGADYATLSLVLNYHDDSVAADSWPMMASISVQTNLKQEG